MSRPRCVLNVLRWTSLVAGALLCGFYALAEVAGEAGRQADLDAFAAEVADPDVSLWSETRAREFAATQVLDVGPAVAVLRIPSLGLTVPVYSDDSELHLNRGVGLVAGSGTPDTGGNAAIAGHRDGYFRALMNVQPGATMEVQTRLRVHRYTITSIDIVDKSDNRLLADTEDPTLTLVTCYPFYFVGAAPKRYLVRGAYNWPSSYSQGKTNN